MNESAINEPNFWGRMIDEINEKMDDRKDVSTIITFLQMNG